MTHPYGRLYNPGQQSDRLHRTDIWDSIVHFPTAPQSSYFSENVSTSTDTDDMMLYRQSSTRALPGDEYISRNRHEEREDFRRYEHQQSRVDSPQPPKNRRPKYVIREKTPSPPRLYPSMPSPRNDESTRLFGTPPRSPELRVNNSSYTQFYDSNSSVNSYNGAASCDRSSTTVVHPSSFYSHGSRTPDKTAFDVLPVPKPYTSQQYIQPPSYQNYQRDMTASQFQSTAFDQKLRVGQGIGSELVADAAGFDGESSGSSSEEEATTRAAAPEQTLSPSAVPKKRRKRNRPKRKPKNKKITGNRKKPAPPPKRIDVHLEKNICVTRALNVGEEQPYSYKRKFPAAPVKDVRVPPQPRRSDPDFWPHHKKMLDQLKKGVPSDADRLLRTLQCIFCNTDFDNIGQAFVHCRTSMHNVKYHAKTGKSWHNLGLLTTPVLRIVEQAEKRKFQAFCAFEDLKKASFAKVPQVFLDLVLKMFCDTCTSQVRFQTLDECLMHFKSGNHVMNLRKKYEFSNEYLSVIADLDLKCLHTPRSFQTVAWPSTVSQEPKFPFEIIHFLPKKFSSTNLLYCSVCKTHFDSQTLAAAHYISKDHLDNCAKCTHSGNCACSVCEFKGNEKVESKVAEDKEQVVPEVVDKEVTKLVDEYKSDSDSDVQIVDVVEDAGSPTYIDVDVYKDNEEDTECLDDVDLDVDTCDDIVLM